MSDKAHDEIPEAIFEDEARQKLLEGVEMLARAVTTTLGPCGKNVIIQHKGKDPIVTKDGVTVAESLNLRDPYQQMGCQVVREVAQRTNDTAGDGTTTATCLAHAIFAGGMKLLAAGHSGVELKRGIDAAVRIVVDALRNAAKPVDEPETLISIGTISANGERSIGELLARAFERVGQSGVITIEDAKGLNTTLDVVEGARYERSYLSSYFVTDSNRMVCELDNPLVLISNLRFSAAADIIKLLEAVNIRRRSLLIIADEVEGEVLQLLVTNHMRGTLRCCAIKAPAFGEQRVNMLNDIAALTGGQLITSGDRMDSREQVETIVDKVLGSCKRVIIEKSRTTFINAGSNKEAVSTRVDSIREQLRDPTLSTEARGQLSERLAKLAGGVAVIRVGGATEVELKERKYRVEDALNAVQAAVEEGVVPGGGVALLHASKALHKHPDLKHLTNTELLGVELVRMACRAPLKKIVDNASNVPSIIVERELENSSLPNFGFNAATGEFVEVFAAGIIDPVKVTRCAIENAGSVAGLLLTVSSCVLDSVNE